MDLTVPPGEGTPMLMKTIFIKDIQENQKVEGLFLVKQKTMALTRTGNPYLSLMVGDKTGDMKGRVWEQAEALASRFEKDDFIWIESVAVSYQNSLQLTITSVKRCLLSEIDVTDFIPQAQHDREESFRALITIIDTIQNPYFKQLLNLFAADEDFVRLFKLSPAAKKLHHVYLGGLLEHTLSVANLILRLGTHYPGLHRDLLLTGGILHDIGKVHELAYTRSFDYTDAGRLLGHIMLGIEMINQKISLIPDFPPDLARELKHLLISHHGEYAYGSPKRPKTVEALILYYLDDLDAKVQDMQSFIEKEQAHPSMCAGYHQSLDRYIYKSLKPQDQETLSATQQSACGPEPSRGGDEG